MDWKEQLDKKEKELNIKEETHETKSVPKNRSIGGGSNNSSSISKSTSNTNNIVNGGSGNLFRGRISEKTRKLNNVTEKGGKGMITVEAALSDLEAIDKGEGKYAGKTDTQKVIEVAKVLVKFLSTIRSNQLLTEEEKVKIRTERKNRETKKEIQ